MIQPHCRVAVWTWPAAWVFGASICTAADDATYPQQLAERRGEYVRWIADTFGELEATMDPRDGLRWALNHARLMLDRDIDETNQYFKSFGPLPRDSDAGISTASARDCVLTGKWGFVPHSASFRPRHI